MEARVRTFVTFATFVTFVTILTLGGSVWLLAATSGPARSATFESDQTVPAAEIGTRLQDPDGVPVDGAGNPHYATFSLCARDPATGELGVAVTTRVPFVGRAVPWVRVGVGAVATQAWTVVDYGARGLDLLAAGATPEEALSSLLAEDRGRERRQLGILDAQGRTAHHTGKETGPWAGARTGRDYTAQGNILVGEEVLAAVAEHFERSAGSGLPLAERMILALEAGQRAGGDKRWGLFQSAAIRIADPRDPGRAGDHVALAIDVGEHPEPVAEMKRIYYTTGRRLGYRSFSAVRGNDVVELKRALHRLGFWRPTLERFPETPRFQGDRSLLTRDPAAFQQQLDAFRGEADAFDAAYAEYDAEAIAAVDAFRKARGLDYEGTPPGLVDQRLVDALQQALMAAAATAPAGSAPQTGRDDPQSTDHSPSQSPEQTPDSKKEPQP
jgi:uncharacterized Ntn-hydrolase superfamily protein